LKEHFSITTSFVPIISFGITFVAIVLGIKIIGFVIDKIVKAVALGIISRLLGGVFGIMKTALIISGLLLIVNTFDYYLNLIPIEQKKQSILYQPISNMIPSIMPNVKDGDSLIKEAEKVWKDAEEKITL
jgi:membrane protein required for colicin V production